MRRTAILISGSGTNLQAFIDRQRDGRLNLDIAVVLSNRTDAYGLTRARNAGIATLCIDHRDFDSRESFDREMASALEPFRPDTIILAGFMRILSPWFVRHFEGRVLNIHPALLPKYPGLNTHARALASGDSHHGSTVHFVTEELDGGPRIVAGRLPIKPGETAEQLQKRVQSIEHRIYPQAAQWVAEGQISYRDGCAYQNNKRLKEPVVMDFDVG
ncbi:MAG: phosphoribosylglycinamide formyltransferase [Woeseiaceae bacterium]|nr:phosphoribosylglycinamide formyltransferase [Woeseiaceae bacterium]